MRGYYFRGDTLLRSLTNIGKKVIKDVSNVFRVVRRIFIKNESYVAGFTFTNV